jgi:sorting nexin-4
LNDVHELLNYCNAAKEQLTERDQKQVDFEDMSQALQAVTLEREIILYPGKNLGQNGSSPRMSDFMTDKMNDSGKSRNERVFKLETKMNEVLRRERRL